MKNILASYLLLCFVSTIPASTLQQSPQDAAEAPPSFDEIAYNWSRTFAEIMQLAHQKHYCLDNAQNSMIKAIDNFLSQLDPHSGFLDPKTYKAVLEATSGEFFGIGIILDNTRQQKDKFLLVVETIPGGPADTAGLKQLDKIIEIDNEPLEGMSTDAATAKLRGQRNSKVHIKVLREGHPDLLSFDITRDVIKEQSSACFYLPQENVYYLSLLTFSETAIKQMTNLVEKAQKQHCKALILDLRNNSGGLLNAAVDIAGLFLKKGSLVVATKNRQGHINDSYVTTRDPLTKSSLPIFILINNYTASAAEILAGCLIQHSEQLSRQAGKKGQKGLMVFTVGSRTFGKGSVQEVIPVSNNCAAKITTSLYYLLNDVSIQGSGIMPDFVIEKQFPPTEQVIWFTKFYGREGALGNFIKPPGYVNDDPEAPENQEKTPQDKKTAPQQTQEKSWHDRTKEALVKDNQFRGALTLINLLDTLKRCSPELVNTRQKAVDSLNKIHVTNKAIELIEVKS